VRAQHTYVHLLCTADHPGGDNSSIFEKGVPKMNDNPVKDFISKKEYVFVVV
jgi:hypothetical protein